MKDSKVIAVMLVVFMLLLMTIGVLFMVRPGVDFLRGKRATLASGNQLRHNVKQFPTFSTRQRNILR